MTTPAAKPKRIPKKLYEAELLRLQGELVQMQEWVAHERRAPRRGLRGTRRGREGRRRSSGSSRTSTPASCAPSRSPRRPSGSARSGTSSATSRTCRRPGRSCCSTAPGTTAPASSTCMGFCTPQEYDRFLRQCPIFERHADRGRASCCASTGSRSAPTSRSAASARAWRTRCERWKLSPMDLESISRWDDYSRAKDEMFVAHRHPDSAPVVRSWRPTTSGGPGSTCIAHLLVHGPVRGRRPTCRRCRSRRARRATGYVRPPRELARCRPRPRGDAARRILIHNGVSRNARCGPECPI